MKKKVIAVLILLIVIGVAVAAYVLMNKQPNITKEPVEPQQHVDDTTRFPEVRIISGEEQIGSLIGYVSEMNTAMLRENLCVVDKETRTVSVQISPGDNEVVSARYEIKTNNGERLIDGGTISSEILDFATYDITVSAILEEIEEYSLVVIVETKEHGEIKYYSRLKVVEENFLAGQIAFAREFSDNTFDDQNSKNIVTYMEPDATLANNNLGFATLKNNYDIMTWGNLLPEKITDTEIELKEIYIKPTGVSGTYQLKYTAHAEGDNQIIDEFNVVETITVWTFNEKQYVLAYERSMNQIWEANENTIRNSFIDLGIQRETQVEFIESNNGNFISFIANGQLWLADIKAKQLTKLYEMEEINKEVSRVMICTTSDEGDVDFITYGYQSGNVHRGENGISICRYTRETNDINEMVFLVSDMPANILESKIGGLCYTNDSVLYLMVEDIIYYVNLITREYGKLTENLKEGNYAINKDRNIVAFNTGGDLYNSTSITISNLIDNTSQTIEAPAGHKIKVCGFSGNHLVYGIAPDTQVDAGKNQINLSEVKVLDENLEEIISYKKDNIYITKVTIADSIIHLERIKKGVQIEEDQLIDNTVVQGQTVTSSYYEDTKKYRELALSLAKNIGSMDQVAVTISANFATATKPMDIIKYREEEKFYVYASGEMKGLFEDKQQAEICAKENDGLVVNSAGKKIWTFEENYE